MKPYVALAISLLASLAHAQRGVVRVRGRPRPRKIDAVAAAPLPVAATAAAPDLGCPEPFGLQESFLTEKCRFFQQIRENNFRLPLLSVALLCTVRNY